MRILLASAHPYIPQIAGGAQSNTDSLAVEFIRRGHPTAVLAGLTKKGFVGLRSRFTLRLNKHKFSCDKGLGYPVYRSWFPWTTINAVAESFGADVVMMQSGYPIRLAMALHKNTARCSIYVHNAEVDDLGGDPNQLCDVTYASNSHFTANWFKKNYGKTSNVVYPIIDSSKYQTNPMLQNVTFINPHKDKGVDIALRVAELCPDIPFVFVLAWTLPKDELLVLKQKAVELKNLTIRDATRDMRTVYCAARIVLVPSQWEEAFGRVAAEAHCSGIPVIGSKRAGLIEAIGPGGIQIDADAPPEIWAEAVKNLWHDAEKWQELSDAARSYAERPELKIETQIDQLLEVLSEHPMKQG